MKRRQFMIGAGALAGCVALEGTLMAKELVPDYMPILDSNMKRGEYLPYYTERELTQPVDLCDERGLLNPAAKGWSRTPLQRCNLNGNFPRKKKWNYWCIINRDVAFSVNPFEVDYLGATVSAFVIDFAEKKRKATAAWSIRKSKTSLPDQVEKTVSFDSKKLSLVMDNKPDRIDVKFRCKSIGGSLVTAEFAIHKPAGHETLNVVIPWSDERFQFTSKQNTLPVEGFLQVGESKKYIFDPKTTHAVLDFGRGMWPYRTYWNWGVITGMSGDDVIGANLGAKWTTGTGANENGICLNGKLTKVSEDLLWEYDREDWSKPWRVRSTHSDAVDVTLKPIFNTLDKMNAGVLRSHGAIAFGEWSGTLKTPEKTVNIDRVMGWGEELIWKW